jgi:hypothetical protein
MSQFVDLVAIVPGIEGSTFRTREVKLASTGLKLVLAAMLMGCSVIAGANTAHAGSPVVNVSKAAPGRVAGDFDSDGTAEQAVVSVKGSTVSIGFTGPSGSASARAIVASAAVDMFGEVGSVAVDTLTTAQAGIPLVRVTVSQGEEGCGSSTDVILVSFAGGSAPKALIALKYRESFSESPGYSSTTMTLVPASREVVLDSVTGNDSEEHKDSVRYVLRGGVFVESGGGGGRSK